MRIEPIHFARWFESSSNWIGLAHVNKRNRELCMYMYVLYMCEHGAKLASAMAAGFTTKKTEDSVSIWGQANVQNELDAVARVSSRGSLSLEALLAFLRIAWVLCTQQWVDMQSTAEEKQQAAPRISHYGTFVRGTCMAERA